MAKRFQRGESKVGCVVGVVILLAAVFVVIKVVPKRIAVAAMQDYVEESAQRTSLLTDKPDNPITQQLTDMFYRKAQEEGLPVAKENIKVGLANGRVSIEIHYRLDIDLMLYNYQWNVEHKVERLTF